MSTPTADIAIVGAGAAGLAAALFAAEADPHARIVLLDAAQRVGAKILVAGGGRCNVTHHAVSPDDYHGNRRFIARVLRAFDVPDTIRWFDRLGVHLKREPTGKLFPDTDDARTVLDALLRDARQRHIALQTGCKVTAVQTDADGFHLSHAQGTLRSGRLVLATGGQSLPKTGSDGSGWSLARALGHTVTATYPALVPLRLHPDFFHARLAGISQDVTLSTFAEGKLIDRRTGSLLWTHFGISGPVVLDASRFWVIAQAEGRSPELRANLLGPDDFAAVERWLIASAAQQPRRRIAALLATRLPHRIAETLCIHTGLPADLMLAQLAREPRRGLIHVLVELPLPVIGDRGWNYAEVTAGGVPLSEVESTTLASRRVPGLYLAGEIMDCDGRIGGFNFQWAWATGGLAGRAAAMHHVM